MRIVVLNPEGKTAFLKRLFFFKLNFSSTLWKSNGSGNSSSGDDSGFQPTPTQTHLV